MNGAAFRPVSLGYSCEVKYQILRRLHGPAAAQGGDPSRVTGERHIFDWQITPFWALTAYLENDFEGVFERRDLTVADDGIEPIHRTLHTRHPHEFPPRDGVLTEAIIDEHYPAARSKFDHLAARFRTHLMEPGPFLYVFKEFRAAHEVRRLIDLLSARSPDHRFHLLLADYEDRPLDLGDMAGEVSAGRIVHSTTKPAEQAWQGDDDAWDRIFDRFELG